MAPSWALSKAWRRVPGLRRIKPAGCGRVRREPRVTPPTWPTRSTWPWPMASTSSTTPSAVRSSRLRRPTTSRCLAAAKAGVLSVVAAGNEGPNLGTITSPASNPAVITVAASSRDGQHSLEALRVDAPAGVAGRYAVREAAFTAPLLDNGPIEAELVLVDDEDETLPDGAEGTTMDGCQAIANSCPGRRQHRLYSARRLRLRREGGQCRRGRRCRGARLQPVGSADRYDGR